MSGSSELEPVGNYAVRITFDDLHNTGIYSWAYLYELGVEHQKRWRAYLDGLAANGLTAREPAGCNQPLPRRSSDQGDPVSPHRQASRPCFSASASLPKIS